MMTINQIRLGMRAKYMMPDITIRDQGRFAEASHQSMMRLNKKCELLSLNHLIAEKLADSELIEKLYPKLSASSTYKRQPDLEEIITELTKERGKRKTRSILYIEYRAINPNTAVSKTHFFRIVNTALKRCKLSMKQLHVAGDVLYIDYAGTQIYYMYKAKKIWVKIFIAVLGASKKMFAWATYGEKTEHWIDGITRAFAYLTA
jgi:transposase